MRRPNFESASGLRPASAYLMIGVALVVVCGKSWTLSHDPEQRQPRAEREDVLPPPDYDLVDREGKPLALSVQRMDLRLSPRAMWQAHTPREVAEKVAQVLGDRYDAEGLLRAFFPDADEETGVVCVSREDWQLGFAEAQRVQVWARELGIEEHLWLERDPEAAIWRLNWRPVELLDRSLREAQSTGDDVMRPITWTRRLADGLARARGWTLGDGEHAPTWKEREDQRGLVWRALLPCADTVAVPKLAPEAVVDLIGYLDSAFVQAHQMQIEFAHERVYPTRTDESQKAAFSVLGQWRYLSAKEARRRARAESPPAELTRGLDQERAQAAYERWVDQRTRELLAIKHPRNGLEGVAARLLARDDFAFIQPDPASYRYRKSSAVHQAPRRYYFDDTPEEPTPRVYSTLDSDLQSFLHETLVATSVEHDAAATLAIVVEVESGDVLAVDGFSPYEPAEFLPTWHLFSPGSTFKVVVMTTALEAGVVQPNTVFDTHNGNYRIPGSGRTIHEARNAPRGSIAAWDAVSRSSNAVMVQIGMLVDDEFFFDKLSALGYRDKPGTGVGRESLRLFAEPPWKPAYTHASISFGHEISITLWQHAQALATILRGGTARPLRTVTGVRWGDEHYRLLPEDGERVFSEDVCATVRDMLRQGALKGTGRHISARERKLGTRIELMSKTGTTEKEQGVACLHLEFERNRRNAALGKRDELGLGSSHPEFIPFTAIGQQPVPHSGSCYTSSICLVGRVPGSEREVMVLLAVEEPRSKLKFGSDVAGPAAIRLLKEALGLTVGGVPVAERAEYAQDYGYEQEGEGREHPWVLTSDRDEDEEASR